MVGGSLSTILQVATLGTLISRRGNKRIGFNKWEPNKKEDLALLTDLFEAGSVVPVIDKSYPLSEVPEALRYLGTGDVRGKLIVKVHPNCQ